MLAKWYQSQQTAKWRGVIPPRGRTERALCTQVYFLQIYVQKTMCEIFLVDTLQMVVHLSTKVQIFSSPVVVC